MENVAFNPRLMGSLRFSLINSWFKLWQPCHPYSRLESGLNFSHHTNTDHPCWHYWGRWGNIVPFFSSSRILIVMYLVPIWRIPSICPRASMVRGRVSSLHSEYNQSLYFLRIHKISKYLNGLKLIKILYYVIVME